MTKLRIAVLDEDRVAQEFLRIALQGYAEVEMFTAQEELLRSGKCSEYDGILVESSAGRRLHLRLIEIGITTPLIYLAENPSVADAIAAVKLGAVEYLSKPVVPEELLKALESAQQQKRTGVPDRFFRAAVALDPMLDVMERELICGALQRSCGVVGGRKGAAALLGVTRTGLLYKMKRLGISRALIAASEPESVDMGELQARPGAQSFAGRVNSSTTA